MFKKIATLTICTIVTAWIAWLNVNYTIPNGSNLQISFLFISLSYFTFNILIDSLIEKNIKGHKERFSFKKASAFSQSVVLTLILTTIWAQSVQALFVAYGLVAAWCYTCFTRCFQKHCRWTITSDPKHLHRWRQD